ncbi:coiled-coil domain-containing protein 189 [Bufo bufo]|uniref:coiled-coil domain-containing protein 189 n=1 Tax=Bufo bufo TaxID=8384 RepID=UPI001ABEC364|nr:coiled-coil domain-containing protein 189 [Bufo bufo]
MFAESGSPGMEALRPVTKAKSQILVWKDVTVRDLERLERAQSDDDLHRALSEWLHVEGGLCEPRASALRDLYYYTVRFCWDRGFSREQTSCVFSVVKETHAACVGSPLGNVAECYRHFQDLLLCHAVHRPPSSISLFSAQQLLHISDYMVTTYFRHFKLYKYVFTPQVKLDLAVTYDGR